MVAEKSFPRGGKKPKIGYNDKKKFDFLGNSDRIGKRRKYKTKVIKNDNVDEEMQYMPDPFSDDDNEDHIKAISADKISAQTIQEGMIILGRVMNITDTKIIVSLPGRLLGAVMASHISFPYTKLLQSYVNDEVEDIKKLNELFKLGEYLNVKVISINRENKLYVTLSAMPQDVNSGIIYNTLQEGCIIRGAIESIEDHGYIIDLGIPNCKTFLPSLQAQNDSKLELGQVIWCVTKKCQRSSTSTIVTVTNKKEVLKSTRIAGSRIQNYSINDLKPGMALDFHVNKPLKDGAEGIILTNLVGYVHVSQIGSKLQIGHTKKAHLLYIMPTSKLPFFTTREIFNVADIKEEAPLKVGTIVENAKVSKVTPKAIIFKFDDSVGIIPKKLSKASETTDENIAGLYKAGSTHNIRIINYHPSDYAYICSDNQDTLDKKYFTFDDFQIGDLVSSEVTKITEKGVNVKIDKLIGWIPDVHISDIGVYKLSKTESKYTSIVSKKFKVGQIISTRVLKVDPSKNLLHLTAKPSLLSPELEILSRYEDAKVDHQYKGTIVHYLKFGVIVSFFGDVRAAVHVKEMSSEPIRDIQAAFNLGQVVSCTILTVDLLENKMTCSLKPPKNVVDSEENNLLEGDLNEKLSDSSSKKKKKKNKKNKEKDNSINANSDINNGLTINNDNEKLNEEINASEPKRKKKKSNEELQTSEPKKKKNICSDDNADLGGFSSMKNFWELDEMSISKNVIKEIPESSNSDTDAEDNEKIKKQKKKKLNSKEKVQKAREEEEKLRQIEQHLTAVDMQPESSDQFDRLLLANPNNSELWIAYMAFHLQSTEIERARSIAKKAIKTISFREENEKFNVWLALLNLENRFGTKESLNATLQEALQANETFLVHTKMLDMFVETGKSNELSGLVDTITAKYKENPEAYVLAGEACYKLHLVEKARAIMQKSINRLDKKKHVPVIIKFAHMENNNGDFERAETLFEQIVQCLPQRTDVWCVYVDMMMKSNKIDHARIILERAISQKLAPKKMKILYKKWMELEIKHGNDEEVERVRRMAKEYVNKAKDM